MTKVYNFIYKSVYTVDIGVNGMDMSRQGPHLTLKKSLPAAGGLGNQTRICLTLQEIAIIHHNCGLTAGQTGKNFRKTTKSLCNSTA